MGTKYPTHTITQGDDAGEYDIKFGHGGLWLGFAPKSDKLIHFYGSTKIGWGKARLRQDKENVFTDRVFVLTPEMGLEVNLTEWLKMSFTAGYRWVNGSMQTKTRRWVSGFVSVRFPYQAYAHWRYRNLLRRRPR